MSKTDQIILTDAEKVQLDELSRQYADVCDQFNAIKAKKDALNGVIKSMFDSYGISKYISSDDVSLSVSVKHNVSFDTDKLLSFCKELNIDGLVKTQEYVDMDELESALYRDKELKESVGKLKIVKPDTVTLRCTRKQTLNE